MSGDDGKVVNMADKSGDARMWTPEQTLEDALKSIRSGKRSPTKLMVVFLDDADDQYDVGYVQAQMSCSQMVGLLEIAKILVMEDMGLYEQGT